MHGLSSKVLRRARKSLGQNFLVDGGVRSRIVSAADLSHQDTVVEVGPGRGFLTRALAEHAGSVVAVELDEALAARLEEAAWPSVRVVRGDAREVPIESLAGRCDGVQAGRQSALLRRIAHRAPVLGVAPQA